MVSCVWFSHIVDVDIEDQVGPTLAWWGPHVEDFCLGIKRGAYVADWSLYELFHVFNLIFFVLLEFKT